MKQREIQQLKHEHNRRLMIEAIGLDDVVYNQMVYKYGLKWIERFLLNDSGAEYAVSKSPAFWAWWKQQFMLIDEQFVYQTNLERIEKPLTGDYLAIARGLFIEMHNPNEINAIPNAFVMKEIREGLREYLAIETENLKRILNNGKK